MSPRVWNWLDEPELAAVLAIVRASGGVGDKNTCAHYEKRAKKLIESLVHEHSQKHEDCSCMPDGYAIFLQSMSSNLDISNLSHAGLSELRGALNLQLSRGETGRIVIVILQTDGLTTNCAAFREFFRPYSALDLHLCVQYYDRAVQHPIRSFLDAIDDWETGTGGKTFCHDFVRTCIGVSVNKEILKQANIANKLLGLKPRNLMIGQKGVEYQSLKKTIPEEIDVANLVDHHTSITFLKATGQWGQKRLTSGEKAAASECAHQLQSTIKTRIKVVKYKKAWKIGDTMGISQNPLPLDQTTGQYRCLCHDGCDKRLDTFDDFVRHHVETLTRLPEAVRLCHLCDFKFAKGCQRRFFDDHFRRHFPPQLACTKCPFQGRTEMDIVKHVQENNACAEGLPAHAFANVSPEHRLLALPDVEHMQEKHQTADAAARSSGKATRKRAQLRESPSSDYQTVTEPKMLLESTFKCPCCPVKLNSMATVKQHIADSHFIVVKCGACGATMNEKAWEAHQRTHMPATVVCKDCDEDVSTSLLKQHQLYWCVAAIEQKGKSALECPVCGEEFEKKDALQKHRAEHQETSMILEYAERAGFVPGNLLELLRNTILTDHDLGEGEGTPAGKNLDVVKSSPSPAANDTSNLSSAVLPTTNTIKDTASPTTNAQSQDSPTSPDLTSATIPTPSWTRIRAVAVNEKGNVMKACPFQKETATNASLDGYFKKRK